MSEGYVIDWNGHAIYWFKEQEDAAAFARLWNAEISPTK